MERIPTASVLKTTDYSFGLAFEMQAQNAGIFVSRGIGIHPKRIITSYELFFVKHGVLSIKEGEVDYEVHEGETLLLSPGIQHEGTKPYPPDLQYYWLHFSIAPTGVTYRKNEIITVKKYCKITRSIRMEELFRWFINDQESGQLQPKIASLMIYLMLNEIAFSDSLNQGIQKISPFAYQTDLMIKTRFAEPALSSQYISDQLHCNSDYLGRVFHNAYGTTITTAIHQARIKYAKTLLLGNSINIKEVALASGFTCVSYFRIIFKRIAGVSPSDFRTTYEKMHVITL